MIWVPELNTPEGRRRCLPSSLPVATTPSSELVDQKGVPDTKYSVLRSSALHDDEVYVWTALPLQDRFPITRIEWLVGRMQRDAPPSDRLDRFAYHVQYEDGERRITERFLMHQGEGNDIRAVRDPYVPPPVGGEENVGYSIRVRHSEGEVLDTQREEIAQEEAFYRELRYLRRSGKSV